MLTITAIGPNGIKLDSFSRQEFKILLVSQNKYDYYSKRLHCDRYCHRQDVFPWKREYTGYIQRFFIMNYYFSQEISG
jgi:hypothetical protein